MSRFQNTTFKAKDQALAGREAIAHEGVVMVVGDTDQSDAIAGKFITDLTTGVANTGICAGIYAGLKITGAESKKATAAAAVYANLDNSGGANVAANTIYGVVVNDNRSSSNSAIGVTAHFGIFETRFNANSVLNPVAFLMDIGRPAANVTKANTAFVTTHPANVAQAATSIALRVRVNGETKYIALFDALN
jgi:hypothetical protein